MGSRGHTEEPALLIIIIPVQQKKNQLTVIEHIINWWVFIAVSLFDLQL